MDSYQLYRRTYENVYEYKLFALLYVDHFTVIPFHLIFKLPQFRLLAPQTTLTCYHPKPKKSCRVLILTATTLGPESPSWHWNSLLLFQTLALALRCTPTVCPFHTTPHVGWKWHPRSLPSPNYLHSLLPPDFPRQKQVTWPYALNHHSK